MNKALFLVALASIVPGFSCGGAKKAATGPLVVINVLDTKYYDDAHIRGSISVPFDEVEAFAAATPKETEVITYCANYHCTASSMAAEQLRGLGFAKVAAYEGGMNEWYAKGFPTDGPAAQSYLAEDNPKPEDFDRVVHEVPVISAEDLRAKMEAAKLL